VLNRPVEFVVHPGASAKLLETEITYNVWIKCYVPMSFQRTLDKNKYSIRSVNLD
jgi:hypothetical protein